MVKLVAALLLCFPPLLLAAPDEDAFEALTARIRAESEDKDFKAETAAQELAKEANVQQLASLIGEESVPLQLSAVKALGFIKKSPAVILFLGSADPVVRGEVAQAILTEPVMEMKIPQLAKSLEYGPIDPVFVGPAIEANARLGTPACLSRLARYAGFPQADPSMRAKAFHIINALDPLPADIRKRFSPTSRRTKILKSGEVLTPELLSEMITWGAKVDQPIEDYELENIITNFSQSDETRAAAWQELVSRDIGYPDKQRAEKLLEELSFGEPINENFLSLWFQNEPKASLIYAQNFLSRVPSDPELWTENQHQAFQNLLPVLADRRTDATDQILFEFLGIINTWGLKQMTAWLEVDEIMALRGDDIPVNLRETFLSLKEEASRKLPSDAAFPSLLFGGDKDRGLEVYRSDQAACTSCHEPAVMTYSLNDTVHTYSDYAKGPYLVRGSWVAEDLLTSLLAPDHDIALGYEGIILTLLDGTAVGGTLLRADTRSLFPTYYIMMDKNGNERFVEYSEIKRLTQKSAMPSAFDSLTQREIRDLMAYLYSPY